MCTAISYKTKDHYFGRNLDLEYHYNETVTITPRQYPFHFRKTNDLNRHYAIIGMATVENGYPLYYDATNECGLSIAALNFPGNAHYSPHISDGYNIAPFELIPWILAKCKTVCDAKAYIDKINLIDICFNDKYPQTPLHWLLSDKTESITIEPMKKGLIIYNNPVKVLTNSPPFDYHLNHLSNYINLTTQIPINRFSDKIKLIPYSNGMGAMGLPGDLSSSSRFVKAAFTKLNSVCGNSEGESVGQFFHILSSVEQQNGCVKIGEMFEKTVYSSCCNTDKCIYYYRTYNNSQITAVNLFHQDIESKDIITFPLMQSQQIRYEN